MPYNAKLQTCIATHCMKRYDVEWSKESVGVESYS